jgi:AcrR family transcriptional regulator
MRSRFIDATTGLLREFGPSGISIRSICSAVGVKPPTLYHYFGDLETLRLSVVDAVISNYFSKRRAAPGSLGPYAWLRTNWDNFVAFSIDEPFLYALIVQQHFSGPLPGSVIESRDELIKDFRELSRVYPLRYSPELGAEMFLASLLGTVAMLVASQHAGLPPVTHLSDVMREETFRALLG